MRDESRKSSTVSTTPTYIVRFTAGMNSCPFTFVGCLIRMRGQKCRFMASLNMENEPLISAWLATIAAPVAITIAKSSMSCGTMA